MNPQSHTKDSPPRAGGFSLLGVFLVIHALLLAFGLNFRSYGYVGDTSYPVPGGSTKASILSGAANDEEIVWEQDVVQISAGFNPFVEMTGGMGSGKPVIIKNDTKAVKGTQIVITTVDAFGAPMIQGADIRVGNEEQVSAGDFKLYVDIGWFGAAIDNTGKSQTIVGDSWESISQEGLAERLAKQQSDDAMINLRNGATLDNTVVANGKDIDSLGTSDTFSYNLVVATGGALRDIGAQPIDARPVSLQEQGKGKIGRYMNFGSEQNMRPIKTDSAYLEAMKLSKERGDTNNFFTGDFSDVDNNILYPWQVVRHGAIRSIGAVIQPDALLGTAIVAKATSDDLTVGLTGGGAKTGSTPYRNYFEMFSRFPWKPINGQLVTYNSTATAAVTGAFNPRDSYGYVGVINSTDGKIAIFRYTTNTAAVGSVSQNKLGGASGTLKRLGSTATTDYLTTFGSGTQSMTWGTAPWTTTPDGNGYKGLTEGLLASGSKIYEINAKGTPIGYGYGMGEMALVCGYGRVPLPGGGFKTSINRTEYIGPHNQNFGKGIEVSYGTAAFKRPDGITPNYVLQIFARKIAGFPVIP